MSIFNEKGLREQLKSNILHKFEPISRKEFEELTKVMDHVQKEHEKEQRLKDELKNIKGPKKKLEWKKE
jgi:hypothetical protein